MQPVPCPAVQPVPCPPVQPVLCSVLVLSSRGWPYDAMKEAWLANWERHAPPDCTLHFLHGRDGGPPPGGRHDLVVECEEALVPGALAKTLDGIVQVLREHDPAYVFRTNLSSHVDLQQLASFLQTCPRNDFASGCSPRRDHLCGAGYALSADLAGRLLTAPLEWGLLDDLAVSRWLLALPDVQVHWARAPGPGVRGRRGGPQRGPAAVPCALQARRPPQRRRAAAPAGQDANWHA